MTAELLKTIFDWSAVILVFLTFVAGAGALITGNIINERQAEKLRQFDKDLTTAKTDLGKQQERVETIRGENLRLEKELLLMGPRANLVSMKRDELLKSLEPFAGQKLDVRCLGILGSLNGVPLGSRTIADERDGLASSLIEIFKQAGWIAPTVPLSSGPVSGGGLSVHVLNGAAGKTRSAAAARVSQSQLKVEAAG